jgi:hypothetical protein
VIDTIGVKVRQRREELGLAEPARQLGYDVPEVP